MGDLDRDECKIDIHHVFPRVWCLGQRIPPKTFNSIINKTAISYKANRMIGGKAPSAYLAQIEAKAKIDESEMDQILQTHLIDPALLRANDFAAYYQARKNALLEVIATVMGKPTLATSIEPPAEDAEGDEESEEGAEV